MSTLHQASKQWASRPADERFTSLHEMQAKLRADRLASRAVVVPSSRIRVVPVGEDHRSLAIEGPNGHAYAPTHYSFGQLASLVSAPAGYLRTIPSEMAADCLNYGLQIARDTSDVGCLITRSDEIEPTLRAATGPNYGRIWNTDIIDALVRQHGDGVSGAFRVPGEFGRQVEVTRDNTTLYAGDRDMFVFLADESRRIEVPNRRNGSSGSLSRGFFVWNSEVGSATFGVATFLFDYVCCNRIVWGAEGYREIKIRHTASAPDRFLTEIRPALESYVRSSTDSITNAITEAKKARIDNVDEFLSKRFGLTKGRAATVQAMHELEEHRPIETIWDAVTGVTAAARGIAWQDERVALERVGGKILDLVA